MTEINTTGVAGLFNNCSNGCEPAGYVAFQWSVKGVGFGSIGFYTKDDKVNCNNELMSREFIKDILCKMVDDCIMEEPNKKI